MNDGGVDDACGISAFGVRRSAATLTTAMATSPSHSKIQRPKTRQRSNATVTTTATHSGDNNDDERRTMDDEQQINDDDDDDNDDNDDNDDDDDDDDATTAAAATDTVLSSWNDGERRSDGQRACECTCARIIRFCLRSSCWVRVMELGWLWWLRMGWGCTGGRLTITAA